MKGKVRVNKFQPTLLWATWLPSTARSHDFPHSVGAATSILPSSFNAVNQLVLPLELETILCLASNNGRKLQAVHSIFNRLTSWVAHKLPGKRRIRTG